MNVSFEHLRSHSRLLDTVGTLCAISRKQILTLFLELLDPNLKRGDGRHGVEQQLDSHQKEIDHLHQTNTELMNKLNQMTMELHELKAAKTVPGLQSIRNTSDTLSSSDELIIASELFDLEVKQLRETKATFHKVIRSLQAKSADLEVLEQWCDPNEEAAGQVEAKKAHGSNSPTESRHSLADHVLEVAATGGAVNVQIPTVVPGHYAASESGIVEIPIRSVHKSASDNNLRLARESGPIRSDFTRSVKLCLLIFQKPGDKFVTEARTSSLSI
jgi:hypothetical protein